MPATAAICCRCKKDVSNEKRVKDKRGNLYCEPCYKAAVQQQQQRMQQQQTATAQRPAAAASSAAPRAAAPSRPAVTQTIRKPAAPPPPPPSATPAQTKLPEFCPVCNAPVLKNRKICFKCNRDLTKMDKILALRAEQAKVSSEEKVGNAIGSIIKVIFILIVIGGVGFMGYGAWMMLHPGKPFDDYPTTRLDAVKGILAAISEGTDKSYEKAFKLITLHVRTTDNAHQDLVYKMVYQKMHDEFLKLYGPDWLSKTKIEKASDPSDNDEIVPYTFTIGDDVYHIDTQAQIAGGNVSNFENTLLHGHQEYLENGDRHFGIYEIEEYTVRAKTKDERQGPDHLHLKALDDAQNNAADDNAKPKPDSNAPAAP
jgi:hypothetical protein